MKAVIEGDRREIALAEVPGIGDLIK